MDDTNGFLDYIRIRLLLNRATILLRQMFKELYKKECGEEWTYKVECGQNFITHLSRDCFNSMQEIEKNLLQTGDINQWDISIFSVLFTSTPLNLDKIQTQNLHSLAEIHNNIAHLGSRCISPEQFSTCFAEAKIALISLGGDADEFEKIETTTTNISELESKTSDLTADENMIAAQKLREDGNLALNKNEFDTSITSYSNALKLNGISDVERGLLFSNRSHAYLMSLNNPTSTEQMEETLSFALEDGKSVIKFRPTWWKGYYRLGKVYQFQKVWTSAVTAFNQALVLDPTQEEVQKCYDECQYELNRENIQQQLNPENVPRSLPENVVPTEDLIKMYEQYLESDDPEIQAVGCVFFGHRNAQGTDVPLNYKKAAQLYSKAAAAGNAEGIYNLGLLYQDGQGVERNMNRAIELFEQAAELPTIGFLNTRNVGVAEAQNVIGNCYRDGIGKKQDYFKAFNWYTQSCENGNGEAANSLAFLYRDGLGVQTDEEKAAEFWILAADRGVTIAMESLAWNYIKLGDVDEAQIWFQRSLDEGNVNTLMNKNKFDEVSDVLRFKIKDMQTRLGLDETYNTFGKCREAAEKRLPEDMIKGIANLETVLKSLRSMTSNSTLSMEDSLATKIWKCVPEIELKAANKCKYAQSIKIAVMAYGTATNELMELMKNPKKATVEMKLLIVSEYAKCFNAAEFIASLTPEMRETLDNICQELFTDEKSPIDINARICHAYLIRNSFLEVLEFLRLSRLKYPGEVYFHSGYCNIFGALKRYEEGIGATTESLKMFPNDVEILYTRAVLFRLNTSESDMERKSKVEIIKKAYSTFLQCAPVDHRLVPEALYCLAHISLISDKKYLKNKKIPKEVFTFFENGLSAEENLLQCFLPYDSNQKTKIQALLNGNESNSSKPMLPETTSILVGKLSALQLTNPNRVAIVHTHRAKYAKCQKNVLQTTQKPIHPQLASDKPTNLKEISLAEMVASNEDHVYNGLILTVTIMEDSFCDASGLIHTIIMDANGDFQKCLIYNLDHEDRKSELSFGSTLSILNPCFSLTLDAEPGIRVNDPESIIFHTNGLVDPKCRYCGASNPCKNCVQCKRAYCSKECQQGDWRKLKHKVICSSSTPQ